MAQVQSASLTAYKRTAALDSTMFYMGNLISFLARGEDTGGRFALMEAQGKPGNEPPPHVHEWEHETYYVLEGEMEFYCEDKILTAHAGEVVFLPQGKSRQGLDDRTRQLALLGDDGPTGGFFEKDGENPW